MACSCASQAMIYASSYPFASPKSLFFFSGKYKNKVAIRNVNLFTVRASTDDSDCNDEECAPDKEVGKVSVEWLAEEKTKVVGTYPPRKRRWTGYVEKDTAGQTNIYSVEPAVYVAESAISSGTAGSSDGAENTAAIAGGLGLISVAAASLILLQVGKNPPAQIQTVDYNGPSLSYYINKFKPTELVQASVTNAAESSPFIQAENSSQEAPQIEAQSEYTPEPSVTSTNTVS